MQWQAYYLINFLVSFGYFFMLRFLLHQSSRYDFFFSVPTTTTTTTTAMRTKTAVCPHLVLNVVSLRGATATAAADAATVGSAGWLEMHTTTLGMNTSGYDLRLARRSSEQLPETL